MDGRAHIAQPAFAGADAAAFAGQKEGQQLK